MDDGRFRLAPEQVAFFETFGFLALPGLLAADVPTLVAGFEEIFAADRDACFEAHERVHFGGLRLMIPRFVERSAKLSWLPDDPRIAGIARSLCGPHYEYAHSDGNLFYCDTNWHPDVFGVPTEGLSIKLYVYLDPLTRDEGAVRFLPGTNHYSSSYAARFYEQLWHDVDRPEVFGVPSRDLPSWTVETRPGDVVVGNFRTFHATFGGRARRRLFTVNFHQVPETGSADASRPRSS